LREQEGGGKGGRGVYRTPYWFEKVILPLELLRGGASRERTGRTGSKIGGEKKERGGGRERDHSLVGSKGRGAVLTSTRVVWRKRKKRVEGYLAIKHPQEDTAPSASFARGKKGAVA